MALATAEIAARSAIALLVGIGLIAGVSTYTARPARRGPVSLWIAFPVLAGRIGLTVGCLGTGVALSRIAERGAASLFVGLLGFLAMLWSASIAVQIAQNFGYGIVGAPIQAIRWTNAPRSTGKRRRKKNVRAGPPRGS